MEMFFVSTGRISDLLLVNELLAKTYKISSTRIGPGDLEKTAHVLNRIVTWIDGQGITSVADERHVKVMVEKLDCGKNSKLKVPMEKVKAEDDATKERELQKKKADGKLCKETVEDSSKLLSPEQTTLYRAISARANYLCSDRADIAFTLKDVCRWMSEPRVDDMKLLERLTRYLMMYPTCKQWFQLQASPGKLTAYTDTDWAGCVKTRRSITGGVITRGRHAIRTWCKTQALIALSSGEAELYGAVRASPELIGMMSTMKDLGFDGMNGEVLGDANAALGIIHRIGTGTLRHLNTNWLWVQDFAVQIHIAYNNVSGNDIVADLFTKALDQESIHRHMQNLDNELNNDQSEGEHIMDEIDFVGPRPVGVHVAQALASVGIKPQGLCGWTRVGLDSKTYRQTTKNCPPMVGSESEADELREDCGSPCNSKG